MNRKLTNAIRFIMDECIPPIIRDSKWFMYPFYFYAYRGRSIKEVMRFKSLIHTMSETEYSDFYNSLNTISRNRISDLNTACVNKIISEISCEDKSLLDVGCGHGYLLNKIYQKYNEIELTGCDLKAPVASNNFSFINGNISQLDLPAKSYDIVCCCHTLEHILDPHEFVAKLKDIAKKKLIIVVPKQRYYYYTLDEHVNFFHYKEKLINLVDCRKFSCENIWGDWMYIGEVNS